MVRPKGLEPPTPGSEDRCSIQLSYGRLRTESISMIASVRTSLSIAQTSCLVLLSNRYVIATAKHSHWEERRDSNPRPPGPQPGALTSCATLPMCLYAVRRSSLPSQARLIIASNSRRVITSVGSQRPEVQTGQDSLNLGNSMQGIESLGVCPDRYCKLGRNEASGSTDGRILNLGERERFAFVRVSLSANAYPAGTFRVLLRRTSSTVWAVSCLCECERCAFVRVSLRETSGLGSMRTRQERSVRKYRREDSEPGCPIEW